MTYLNDLIAETKLAATRGAVSQGYVPLTDQIEGLMAILPGPVLHRPWSLEELMPRLEGKYRDRPATRSVAQALRQLGWRQQRCWKKNGLNRRLWMPPTRRSK